MSKRPAGISKGLWKMERQAQITGEYQKKGKSSKKRKEKPEDKKSDSKLLGKRDYKTATKHKTNTSTFKK
jgi:hypothetical protein